MTISKNGLVKRVDIYAILPEYPVLCTGMNGSLFRDLVLMPRPVGGVIHSKELFWIGYFLNVAIAVITAVVGIVSLTAGISGYFFGSCNAFERIALVIASLMLLTPGMFSDFIGFGLFIIVLVLQWLRETKLRQSEY